MAALKKNVVLSELTSHSMWKCCYSVACLTCYTQLVFILILYKGTCKSFVMIQGISDSFFSEFSESWFPFSSHRFYDPKDLGSIPGRIIPKTQKWYLIPPCLTLNNIKYVSRVKWSNPGKGVAPSPTPWCSGYWK